MDRYEMRRRACPHLGGKKCIGDKCVAWDEGPLTENTASGPVDKWATGCVIYFWGPIWQRETCARLNGTQKGVESLRNNEHNAFVAFSKGLQTALERKLNGDQGKITERPD